MEEKATCGNCVYFVRHYIRNGRKFQPLSFGHCTYPRIKSRTDETPACDKFLPQSKYRASPKLYR